MQVILLEDVANVECSQLEDFYKKYPKSARAFITNHSDVDSIMKYKQPPIISSGWLLICNGVTLQDRLKALNALPGNNVIIHLVHTRKALANLQDKLDAINASYSIIDNYVVSEENVTNMIMSRLAVSSSMAELIYKKCKGDMQNIMATIGRLLALDEPITPSILSRNIITSKDIPIFRILNFLLREEGSSSKDALKVIAQYRYAPEHLLKYLRESLTMQIKIFELVHDGDLTLENLNEVLADRTYSFLKGMHAYTLKKAVESFSRISIDYLLFLSNYLERLSGDLTGLMHLAQLILSI